MRFGHPDHPTREVRLAYCLNLHPADDLDGVLAGMERITLPLRERLGLAGEAFGVGPWLPAPVAMALTADEGEADLDRLIDFVVRNHLDAFTFNAFPYERFHEPGLKRRVFRPDWASPLRMAFTLAVAQIALVLRSSRPELHTDVAHLSISTHCGGFGNELTPAVADEIADNFALMALHLSKLEDETGQRIVLSLEPEPRSAANDTRALTGIYERILHRSHEVIGRGHASLRGVSEDIVQTHIGACLDACHAAVEYEEPEDALRAATSGGAPLGKLQFSSALALERPDENAAAREALLAMDEPVYLHQVTGRRGDDRLRVDDLSELAALHASDPAWKGCDEWRCHYHVPVDLDAHPARPPGLRTTRTEADAALAHALASPDRWHTGELHVEIETYTWNVLGDSFQADGDLLAALEREYNHVLGCLEAAGWRPTVAAT